MLDRIGSTTISESSYTDVHSKQPPKRRYKNLKNLHRGVGIHGKVPLHSSSIGIVVFHVPGPFSKGNTIIAPGSSLDTLLGKAEMSSSKVRRNAKAPNDNQYHEDSYRATPFQSSHILIGIVVRWLWLVTILSRERQES